MSVKFDITYSIEDALKELDQDGNIQPGDEIIVLEVGDKFFIGGGCEASANRDAGLPQNVSVCMNSPFI